MKRLICLLMMLAMALTAACALGDYAPDTRTLEDTIVFEAETIDVTIDRWRYTYGEDEVRLFIADVQITDPSQILTAFAGGRYHKERREVPTVMAEETGAVLAFNADFYNYNNDISLVIRNGVLYRDRYSARDLLTIDTDGQLGGILAKDRKRGNGEAYIEQGMFNCFEFGPMLVMDNQPLPLPAKYYIDTSDKTREPRTAIGQIGENHYVVIVADGRREGWSDGMTLQEMQWLFMDLGCTLGYNLDGGGSSALVLNGELINKVSGGEQRPVGEILYFSL